MRPSQGPRNWRETPKDDCADVPAAARAADALVAVAETAMAAGPTPCEGGDRVRVNLVIDLDLLLGNSTSGYTIHATERGGEFRLFEPGGEEIGRAPDRAPPDLAAVAARTGIEPTWFTPHAKDAGTRLDLDAIMGGLLWAARGPDPNRWN